MPPRFLQIHTLTAYPAALLNRDDAGFAKRITFGGEPRTRISSQCLKRHWRTFEGEGSLKELDAPESIRSRHTFDREILNPLLKEGVDAELARAVVQALMVEVLGESAKAKKEKAEKASADDDDATGPLATGQVTVLGRPEVDFLLAEARAICAEAPGAKDPKKAAAAVKARLGKDGRLNLQTLRMAAGLDAALFGRMVTSDRLSRGDAAVHVAHAFTVHRGEFEDDYFSAVDDLLKEQDDELGSGHIGTTELTSGLYYGYIVVDLPLLVSNIEGVERARWREADPSLSGQVIERLIQIIATVSPGAKLGSTAPYAYSHLVMVEAGDAQPRTLANAFLRAVPERPDLVANTYEALGRYVQELDLMYGIRTERRLSAIGSDGLGEAIGAGAPVSLADLAAWARSRLQEEAVWTS
ncbi:MAG TPA: type I-E CRISPR-associated protein Cas7/Cse4/CasC [Longimicrobiales bacterium]